MCTMGKFSRTNAKSNAFYECLNGKNLCKNEFYALNNHEDDDDEVRKTEV